MPHTATLATPGTPMRRGRIVQRAITDFSIGEMRSDDSPIMSTRLEEDSGCSSVGGFDTRGSACAWARRSCTSWRARYTSVPGSKTRTIEDRPVRDSERMTSTPWTPLSRSASSGTVMRFSTSVAESPSASVWISA